MLLKTLSEAMGPSGFEGEVRDLIRSAIRPLVDQVETDVLGSLICKKGTDKAGPRVLLDAHMDEVGLMVVDIEESGLLKFRTLGGIDPRVLVSKPVRVGKEKHSGVIGSKPIHLQDHDESQRPLGIDRLYIDIGATDRADAEKHVSRGDVAVFATEFGPIGENCIKGKALDDRLGCAVLIETLRNTYDLPLIGAFTVQEELGLLGATAVAHRVRPDVAIALETTVCFDVVGAPSHGQGTILGRGPALTVQDSRTIANARFLEFMLAVAEKAQVPVQLRRVKGGSNDFGAIHVAGEGVVGGSISIPGRYLHAPAQIASLDDYENAIRLTDAILQELATGGWTG